MRIKVFFISGFIALCCSCQQTKENTYDYGSKNDSAVYYFNKGWEHIMDYGQWTLSEAAFRKAVKMDSTFLIGKSLVGKITQNLDERKQLLKELKKEKHKISRDDQLLLEITLATMELMNARDQKIDLGSDFVTHFGTLGERNYRKFVHKHPNESYMKAEYVEFLHAQYGARQALDSLYVLVSNSQKELPFFISYSALLEADLGHYEKALQIADRFKSSINDSNIPAPYVLYAQIYSKMDRLKLAKNYVDKAVQLDTNHIIAKRLKSTIDQKTDQISQKNP